MIEISGIGLTASMLLVALFGAVVGALAMFYYIMRRLDDDEETQA